MIKTIELLNTKIKLLENTIEYEKSNAEEIFRLQQVDLEELVGEVDRLRTENSTLHSEKPKITEEFRFLTDNTQDLIDEDNSSILSNELFLDNRFQCLSNDLNTSTPGKSTHNVSNPL